MPRQRRVKPDFFDSGSLAECSRSARLAFIGLWVMGDDNGNVKFSVRKLKKQIFPFDDMPDADFVSLLAELERVGCIKAYEVDGEEYVSTVNFKVYQTVKNPSKTTVPEPPESLSKQPRTRRFQDAELVMAAGCPTAAGCGESEGSCGESAGVVLGECGGYPSTDPELAHDVPPSKERSKEEVIFPSGKITSPSDRGTPTCPMCGVRMWKNNQSGRYECPNCLDAFDRDAVVWR